MKATDIIVNTIAWKEDLERGRAQVELLEQAAQAGLSLIEIRSEFLTQGEAELQALREKADQLGLSLFYSANEDFFMEWQVHPNLEAICQQALLLGAPFVKMNAGNAEGVTLASLKAWSRSHTLPLPIKLENNQDPQAATLANCVRVMELVQAADLGIDFVFDLANWLFVGEDPSEAARCLGASTRYLHCKNARPTKQGWEVASLFAGELVLEDLLSAFPALDYLALEYPASLPQLSQDRERLASLF